MHMGRSVKSENSWLIGAGRPQVVMRSQLLHFLVIFEKSQILVENRDFL